MPSINKQAIWVSDKPTSGSRVAILRFSALFGGVEAHLLTLCHGLSNKGYTPVLIFKDRILAQRAAALGLPTIVIKKKGKMDLLFFLRLAKTISKLDIYLIHSHGMVSDFAAFFVCHWFIRVPHVITVHALPESDYSMGWAKLRLYRAMNNISFKKSDKLIAVSKARKKDLIAIGIPQQKIIVIHNGINADVSKTVLNDPTSMETRFRKGPRIAVIGRLVSEKGIEFLLRAAPSILDKYPNAKFVIIGKGPLRLDLEKLVNGMGIANNVNFLGFISNIWKVFKNIDILVHPSTTEGLPIVLLEAALAGIPIAASRVGGIPELIRHQKEGLLFNPFSESEIIQAVLFLVNDPSMAFRLASQARERIITEFSEKSMINKIDTVYKEVLK